jgi:hypothetical protein
MSTNINPETGIRYGYISAQSIHPDVLYDLIYAIGTDLTYEAAKAEAQAIAERQADDIEEEVRIAIAEAGGFTDREYEHVLEDWTSLAYERLGFDCREDYVENSVECAMDDVYIEEPIIEFEYKGVKGRTSWLGGALNLWIFESPILGMYRVCSPCVPNAGNLDQPSEWGVLTYDVPADWRVKED